MLLLQSLKIKKSYGQRVILDIDDLKVYTGNRIGLVGINGAGKSTLLSILADKLEPDEGTINHWVDFNYVQQLETNNNDSKVNLNLSGGEKTIASLTAAFSQNKPLMILDEPTTNLDLEGIQFLEQQLLKYPGAFILVSHDRELLDRVCNKIIEIQNGKLCWYTGNYTAYINSKERHSKQMEFVYEQYEKEKLRLEQALRQTKTRRESIRNTPKRMGNSEARLHKRAGGEIQKKLARTAKAIQSRIDRIEVSERPRGLPEIKFYSNPSAQPVGKILVSSQELRVEIDKRVLFQKAALVLPKGTHTALIGSNGAGKTTLLKLLTAGDPRLKVAPGTRLGYLDQELKNLSLSRTVLETAMLNSIQTESTVRTILANLMFKAEDITKKAAVLSGGERIKLAIASLLVSNANLLLMDEPGNYLDVYALKALQELITHYPGTIWFVSHDRQFIRNCADRIMLIKDSNIITFEDGYQEYEQWLMKSTPNNNKVEYDLLLLQMRCSELAARLSKPKKSDNMELLTKEYDEIIRQIRNHGR